MFSRSRSSQSRSQQQPLNSQVDVLSRLTLEELQQLVLSPPVLDEGDYQADLELRSPTNRSPLTGDTAPQAVEVHVYNLGENFVGPNHVLNFGPALGGAFHIGVEVFGAEWSYGVHGVACDPPRSETAHVYECSILLGSTARSRMEVAEILFRLCREWRGRDYDMFETLGVRPLPDWVDRLARGMSQAGDALNGAMLGIANLIWSPDYVSEWTQRQRDDHLQEFPEQSGDPNQVVQQLSMNLGRGAGSSMQPGLPTPGYPGLPPTPSPPWAHPQGYPLRTLAGPPNVMQGAFPPWAHPQGYPLRTLAGPPNVMQGAFPPWAHPQGYPLRTLAGPPNVMQGEGLWIDVSYGGFLVAPHRDTTRRLPTHKLSKLYLCMQIGS